MSIKWNKESVGVKLAVCELCGWNKRTSLRIVKTEWKDLSPAAKRVLERSGVSE